MKKGLLIFWLLFLQALPCSSIALTNSAKDIIVVKSGSNNYFHQTINKLTALSKGINFKIMDSDELNSELKSTYKDNIFITLGLGATNKVINLFPDQLVISTYATHEQVKSIAPAGTNHLAILLDQPLERYLAFGHFLTGSMTPGIINSKQLKLSQQQKNILKRLNLNLSQYQTYSSAGLLPRIRQLKNQNDALIMLPNQRLYNRDTLKGILLTAYRVRIPILSYSPAHVKSGALASIYSSPEDIGRQLSELLADSLIKPPTAGQILHYARYYSIKINRRVARSQGFKLPEEADIRQRLTEIQQ